MATTYQDNVASRRVMEKAGMKLVRTYHSTPEELAAGGTFVPTPDVVWEGDDVDYAIWKADWEQMAILTDSLELFRKYRTWPTIEAPLE